MKQALETREAASYTLKLIQPEPEYMLTNDNLRFLLLDSEGTVSDSTCAGQRSKFRDVEVDELEGGLNDKCVW